MSAKAIKVPPTEKRRKKKRAKKKKRSALKMKKFHLTAEQLTAKISAFTTRLEGLVGSQHKTKRKNIYKQLSMLKKARDDPEQFLVDPNI